ncbi:hypothetical protein EB093_02045 [bacterium]|nr:hypothetical protein [bacterium]
MTTLIQFGTSGYRGILGESFTATHVNLISDAIAQWMHAHGLSRLFIGYDPRRGNSLDEASLVRSAASVLIAHGIDVMLSETPVPTPLVSWAVRYGGFHGGLIFTASHNPPEYNGIKFNPPPGGPAMTDVTSAIEALIGVGSPPSNRNLGPITTGSLLAPFGEYLRGYVRQLGYGEGGLPIIVDARHGTAGPLWRWIDGSGGVVIQDLLHGDMRSDFGGLEPNPTDPNVIDELGKIVRERGARFGVAHDPDTDRHAIVDNNGSPVSPEIISAIVLLDWVQSGVNCDGIVSTVASSGVARAMCDRLEKSYIETPVGFKYFTPHFESARSRLIGVESSGGLSVSDYLFEKCGFLPALLVAGVSIRKNMSISMLVEEVELIVGKRIFTEAKFSFDSSKRNDLMAQLRHLSALPGVPVASEVSRVDGTKWIYSDGSWILIRLSGTEPVGRIYCESFDDSTVRHWVRSALNWATQFE